MEQNQVVGEVEREQVLQYISDGILMENVRRQVASSDMPSSGGVDYLGGLDYRFRYLHDVKFRQNDELRAELRRIRERAYSEVLSLLESKFGFRLNPDRTGAAIHDVAELYRFFVIRYRRVMTELLYSEAMAGKKQFVQMFKPETSKKDLGIYSLRKLLRNFDNVVVVHNIEKIVGHVRESIGPEAVVPAAVTFDPEEYNNMAVARILGGKGGTASLEPDFKDRFFSKFDESEDRPFVIFDVKSMLVNAFLKNAQQFQQEEDPE